MKFTFAPESRPLDGFTIKRAIYRGGFGEVYYARSDAGREVALKLLQNNADIELRGIQQCLNLSHPNLVTIFDVRQDGDGDHWVVMEYVAGGTLDTVLRKSPNGLPVEMVRKWLQGMSAGISYLHSRGLVHRDMKPANVFMENNVVKIGDVGLSKFISPSRHSAQTQSVGTVHYMAPEVAKGKYGREVDIYALGIMLYEMLTGELPFDGESTGEILMKHLSEKPDLKKLPPRLQGVIAKALEKDPKERFSRVEALQRAFEDAILGINPIPVADLGKPPVQTTSSKIPAETLPHHSDVPIDARLADSAEDQGLVLEKFSPPWLLKAGLIGSAIVLPLSLARGGTPFVWLFVFFAFIVGAYWVMLRLIRSHVTEHQSAVRSTQVKSPRPRPMPVSSVQASDTLGALFATAPISAALIACMAVLKPSLLGNARSFEYLDLGLLGLFSAITVASSWVAIMVPYFSKKNLRREKISGFHFAMAGAFVGGLAFIIDQYLMVGSLGDSSSGIFKKLGDHALVTDGTPSLGGYIAFFATLFGFRNWQEMTSPFRKYRFSVSAVLITVFVAWLSTMIFSFPSEIAIAWGVVVACVAQLSAPMEEQGKHRHARRVA